MRRYVVLSFLGLACTSIQAEQRQRIAAYKADQSREFVSLLTAAKVDPKLADLTAVVTADAINIPLQKLNQSVFPAGTSEFVPTQPPRVELYTGSALLYVTGVLRKKGGGKQAEVTIVAGLAARWNDEGSHIFFKPSSLAVVPTLGIGFLDFALGSYLRSFAEEQAALYLKERIGEIDIPVQLMLPIQRKAIQIETQLQAGNEPGATIRYELPAATAEVRLEHLYLWLLEGRLVALAFADIGKAPPTVPATPPAPPAAAPAPAQKVQ
jgi:hypothetical protein